MLQQTVKQTNGIPVDANGVLMDAAWAHQVNQTIIDIMARDKGWKITKRVLTRKNSVGDQDSGTVCQHMRSSEYNRQPADMTTEGG